MGRELAIAFPEAREQFELADRVLAGRYERPLSGFVFPPPALAADEKRARQAALTDTHVAQPALGAAELACLGVLDTLGDRAPDDGRPQLRRVRRTGRRGGDRRRPSCWSCPRPGAAS